MSTGPDDFANRLRALNVFGGALPAFDASAAPEDPAELFEAWMVHAIAAGVREPHAMTLATTGPDGCANLRVLILKGVVAGGWRFAGSRDTTKGTELAAVNFAAAAFYWPALGRQVRLRGPVRSTGADASAADFLARGAGARAEALAGGQGQPDDDPARRASALREAEARLESDPGAVARHWTLWEIAATEVEFFQGDHDRQHVRLVYAREPGGWRSTPVLP